MRRHHSWLSVGRRFVDALLVFVALCLLCLWQEIPFSQRYALVGLFGAVLTWICMGAVDAYRPWRSASLWRELLVLVGGWVLVVFGLFFIAWATKTGDTLSRTVIGGWFVLAPLLMAVAHGVNRAVLRALRKRGQNSRTAVIVGAGDLGVRLASRIQSAEWMGINLLGWFDDKPVGESLLGLPFCGRCDAVADFVREQGVDQVYLALPMRAEKRMRQVFDQLQDTTASIFLLPDLFMFNLMGAREHEVGGLPVYSLCEAPFTGPFGLLKRIEDIVLASAILLLMSLPMVVIAIAIKLTSRGSVIFVQDRYGLNGRKIKVYKFRSMTVCENDSGEIKQAGRLDARVTKLGAFLRRTSLDELPQFINVLQGRMSVVGPRPHAVAHNEQYRKRIKGYMWRHKVKPGITGWAQVNGWRGETDTLEKMEKRVEYDLDYIRNWSPWLDIKIVWLTIFRGFNDPKAY